MRPGVAPAVAPHPAQVPALSKGKSTPQETVVHSVASGQIDVKTSGLTFNQNTGVASTSQAVNFATVQGQGSSTGATFDSNKGQLVLDRDVQLNVRHGREAVNLRARHAEFDRNQLTCNLVAAVAGYRNGQAAAGQAQVLFREDGSAVRLDARDGFVLSTATGTRIASPTGSLDFNERNQPREGHLRDGVTMQSSSPGRSSRGTAPSADLAFTPTGELRHAHLERGVAMHSEQDASASPTAPATHVVRDWRSPVAEIDFRSDNKGHIQLADIHGTGGVVITGQTQRAGGPVVPSRMAADDVVGQFGPHQELARIVGTSHASLEQTTAEGARQLTTGDRLEALFTAAARTPTSGQPRRAAANPVRATGPQTAEQIQSATIDGNVVLTQQPAAKPGQQPGPEMRATAGHAVYESSGEMLHLTESPRIDDGAMQLTTDRLDVSQASGDAFAHGNVKASWLQAAQPGGSVQSQQKIGLGGDGPAHVVAAEAQLNRASGEATFRGQARLWQQANSVSAPVIVLDRTRQTLVAHAADAGQPVHLEPVHLVLLSAGGLAQPGRKAGHTEQAGAGPPTAGQAVAKQPQVIRVAAGDLKYSAAERKALLHAAPANSIVAETPTALVTSNEAELTLLPPGNHAAPNGGSAQVDRLVARGNVVINTQDRRGTGEELVYSSESGQYVLTGTAAEQPKMTDPARGTVSGDALIFNTRDDSVSIEGQGQRTTTQGIAPNKAVAPNRAGAPK
jgi:lipopolysaccharide export system protein LptA